MASIDCAEATNPSRLSAAERAWARAVMSGPACSISGRVAALHVGEPLDGELPHGLGAGRLAEPAQRHGGDVEVVVAQVRLALGAQDVAAGGPSGAGAGAGHPLDLDHAGAREVVEVAADGGRGEAQEVAEFGGADGSMLQHGVQDAVTRTLFGVVAVAAVGRGNAAGSGPARPPRAPGRTRRARRRARTGQRTRKCSWNTQHNHVVIYSGVPVRHGLPAGRGRAPGGRRTTSRRMLWCDLPESPVLTISGLVKDVGPLPTLDGKMLRVVSGAVPHRRTRPGHGPAGRQRRRQDHHHRMRPGAAKARRRQHQPAGPGSRTSAGAGLRARVGVMLQDGGLPPSARPIPLLAAHRRHVPGPVAGR